VLLSLTVCRCCLIIAYRNILIFPFVAVAFAVVYIAFLLQFIIAFLLPIECCLHSVYIRFSDFCSPSCHRLHCCFLARFRLIVYNVLSFLRHSCSPCHVAAPMHCPDASFAISELLLSPRRLIVALLVFLQIAILPKHQPTPHPMLLSIVLLSLPFKCWFLLIFYFVLLQPLSSSCAVALHCHS